MAIWIGVACSLVGNILNSISYQLQRYVHVNNVDGVSYIRFPLWWAGLACMIAGEIGNFIAYGMVSASMISPLGAVAVILNAILSRVFLKEKMSFTCMLGVAAALVGTVLIVLNTPTSNSKRDMYDLIVSWQGLGLLIAVSLGTAYIANPLNLHIAISREFANTQVVCYCALCSLWGVITVTSSKCVSTAIDQATAGDNAMFTDARISWLAFLLIFGLMAATVLQVIYLNTALMHFGSSVVVPVYYVMFTSVSISTGMVLFDETSFDPLVRGVLLFITGVGLAFFGVYLINAHGTPVRASCSKLDTCFRSAEIREWMQNRF